MNEPIDPERYRRLEALYAALKVQQSDPCNVNWREVLRCFRDVDEAAADACRLAALRRDEGKR